MSFLRACRYRDGKCNCLIISVSGYKNLVMVDFGQTDFELLCCVVCCVVLCCVKSCRVVSSRVVSCRVVSTHVETCRVVCVFGAHGTALPPPFPGPPFPRTALLLARFRNCRIKSLAKIFNMLNQYVLDIPTLSVNLCFPTLSSS